MQQFAVTESGVFRDLLHLQSSRFEKFEKLLTEKLKKSRLRRRT